MKKVPFSSYIFLNEYDIPFFLKAFKGLDGTTLGLISSSSYSYWTYSSTTSSISTRRYFALEHPIMTRNPRALIRIVTCFILDWYRQLRFRIKICFSDFRVFNLGGDTFGMNCHHRLSRSFIAENKRPRFANLRVILSFFNPTIMSVSVIEGTIKIRHSWNSSDSNAACRQCNILS